MERSIHLPVSLSSLSLLIAGSIYILFRTESLILFEWFQWLQLMPAMAELRTFSMPWASQLPEWVVFSLPDGLWLLSFLLFVRVVWADASKRAMWVWSGVGMTISFGHELAQALGVVPGTFDWVDLLAYLVASAVALGPRWAEHLR